MRHKLDSKCDWQRFDAMTEAERHAAALSDPDAQPITPDNERHMKLTAQLKIIRRALGFKTKNQKLKTENYKKCSTP
jgi:putative transcriptional regulator